MGVLSILKHADNQKGFSHCFRHHRTLILAPCPSTSLFIVSKLLSICDIISYVDNYLEATYESLSLSLSLSLCVCARDHVFVE